MPLASAASRRVAAQIQQRVAAAPDAAAGRRRARARGGQSSNPGSNGAKNHARPASSAVPTKLMHQREIEGVDRPAAPLAQSWRCSTISIRRFCSRPSAVVLGAIGSASARPSALTRAGSPTHRARRWRAPRWRARRRAGSSTETARCGSAGCRCSRSHQRPALAPQRRGDPLQQRQPRSARRRCPAANIARSAIRMTGVAGGAEQADRAAVDVGLQAGAQPVERPSARAERAAAARAARSRRASPAACARAARRAPAPAGRRTPHSGWSRSRTAARRTARRRRASATQTGRPRRAG